MLALAIPSPVQASAREAYTGAVVRDWSDTARSQPFENPVRLARILAIMHAAQHDAVNGAQPRYETYASTLRNPRADAEAAAAAAAHEVLVASSRQTERRSTGGSRSRSRPSRTVTPRTRAWRSGAQWVTPS